MSEIAGNESCCTMQRKVTSTLTEYFSKSPGASALPDKMAVWGGGGGGGGGIYSLILQEFGQDAATRHKVKIHPTLSLNLEEDVSVP